MTNENIKSNMVNYLKSLEAAVQKDMERFGMDRGTQAKYDALAACLDMASEVFGTPVYFTTDNKFHIGEEEF